MRKITGIDIESAKQNRTIIAEDLTQLEELQAKENKKEDNANAINSCISNDRTSK